MLTQFSWRANSYAACVACLTILTVLYPSIAISQDSPGASPYLAHLAAANSALRLNEATEARRWLDAIPAKSRGWEWQLLNARSDSSIARLDAAGWTPVRLDLARDGEQLAVAATDGRVRFYRTKDLQLLHEWKVAEQAVYAARFAPDGRHFATCSRDGEIATWQLDDGTQVWHQKSGGEGLADLVYRPDGQQLLFCSWFRGQDSVVGLVSTWNAKDGQLTWKTDFGVKPIVVASYSPDGGKFAVGTWDGLLGVWNAAEPRQPQVYDFHDMSSYSAVDDIAFSPDGQSVAVAAKNGIARVWKLTVTSPPIDLSGHGGGALSVAFSRDGAQVLVGGADGVLTAWDVARRTRVHRYYGHSNRIGSIVIHPTQAAVFSASADQTIRRWSLIDSRGFDSPEAGRYCYGMVVSEAGLTLVCGGQSETTITVWDAKTKEQSRHFPGLPGSVNYLDGDGRELVAGGNWGGDVVLWNVRTGQEVRRMGDKKYGGMQQCALSDDGRWIASATNKRQVVIWNAQSGELAKIIPVAAGCWGIDFAPDNRAVVVGDGAGVIHWFATDSWEEQWSAKTGAGQINCVRVASDGTWLAAGADDGQLAIVDTQTHQVRHLIRAHHQRIWSLDISPDQSRIITGAGDAKVRVWDAGSGEATLTLSDFAESIYNVRFAPDGKSFFVNSLGSRIARISLESSRLGP